MKEGAGPVSYAHAHWLVAMACVTTGNPQKAIKYMNEAADSVERNRDLFLSQLPGLSSVPVTASVDYSEALHERLGLLAHILWFRTYMSIFLVDSGIYPVPDTVPDKIPVCVSPDCYPSSLTRVFQQLILEKFEDILYGPHDGLLSSLTHLFQNYLPVGRTTYSWVVYSLSNQIACPVLFEVCPLMARVRTMLLIRKARKLIAKHASERQYTYIYMYAPPTYLPLG